MKWYMFSMHVCTKIFRLHVRAGISSLVRISAFCSSYCMYINPYISHMYGVGNKIWMWLPKHMVSFPIYIFFLNICNTVLLDCILSSFNFIWSSTWYSGFKKLRNFQTKWTEYINTKGRVLTMELVILLDCHYVFVLLVEWRNKWVLFKQQS